MADYVNKNILSEAYVHIEQVTLTPSQKVQFEQTLLDFAQSRGRFSIYEDIVPEVRTRDGSLKVYATVTGTLTEALGDYANFDVALDDLYTDAKRLAEAMILETLFTSRARGKSVLRREARTGIVKSAKDLFDQIKLAGNEYEDDSARSATKRVQSITERASNLLKVLTSEADIRLIAKEAFSRVKALPIPIKIKHPRLPSEKTQYEAARGYLISVLTASSSGQVTT